MIIHRARRVIVGLALAAALTGCSGALTPGTPQAAPTTATAAPAPTTVAPADAEAAIRAVYDRYNKALLGRDFATACAILTERAAATMSSAVTSKGGPSGLSCPQAFQAIYGVPGSAAQLDVVSRGITIESIEVSGDTATVTYGVTAAGKSITGLKWPVTRVDGTWRVEGTS